jgi:ATP-dependent DNA helicase RecQ
MEDQVNALRARAGPCAAISLDNVTSPDDQVDAYNGKYQLVFVSPEKATSPRFMQNWPQQNLPLFVAVDEAHCLSQWGHAFRPAFLELSMIRTIWPFVPIMALTATAVARVRSDIVSVLQLRNPFVSCKVCLI